MLSILIPANNEEAYIGPCLDALLASRWPAAADTGTGTVPVEIVVVANGCSDATAAVARAREGVAAARGWRLVVIDHPEGRNKLAGLARAEQAVQGDAFVYLDADILVSPDLLAQIGAALDRPEPAYASGRLRPAPAQSWVTRLYGRFWTRMPFVADCVPGCGVFAMNAAGRARWGAFPPVMSDDTFARLQFAPNERVGVAATFDFPLVEGFERLVRVRRRQDVGVAEIARMFPALLGNDDKPPMTPARVLGLFLRDPAGFAVYGAVSLAVKLGQNNADQTWVRGR